MVGRRIKMVYRKTHREKAVKKNKIVLSEGKGKVHIYIYYIFYIEFH